MQLDDEKGIGYRLVCAVLERAGAVGLKGVEAECLAENRPVTGLLRKAGFVEEGLRRSAIQKQGEYRDVRLFGLLL